MILNCIAVDDEPLALGLVCSFIEKTPFLKLVGRYASAVAALKEIPLQKIDIIFLDIQMPDLNGLELARILGYNKGANKPRVIFTTAYLLKPFDYEEFLRAANKGLAYHELLNRPDAKPVIEETVADEEYLFLKVEYQLVRVALNDIIYIESLKDYIKVWVANSEKAILSLTSLKAMEEKLPAKRFMRIHRSFIVSLDKIKAITRNTVQIGKVNIHVGDQYKDAFTSFLNKWS